MTIHEEFAEALGAGGVQVVDVFPASGRRSAPNPTTIVVRTGSRRVIPYQLFAWNITHEGKGRVGDNLRVQATSFGQKNSPVAVDPSVLGLGWSGEYGVFVGFDPWIKRNPGSSSSVHIKRSLLESGGAAGWLEGGESWDPRVAFTHAHAAPFLVWHDRLWAQKTVSVVVEGADVIDADRAVVRVDPVRSKRAYSVREGDRIARFDQGAKSPDQYLWRVHAIDEVPVPVASGRNRFNFVFTCEKSARVRGQVDEP